MHTTHEHATNTPRCRTTTERDARHEATESVETLNRFAAQRARVDLELTRHPHASQQEQGPSAANAKHRDAIKDLKLQNIRIDGGTQARAELSEPTVEHYAELLEESVTLPPAVVFFDGSHNWLADGFTRYMAYRQVGRHTMPCDVREGTLRDAILFAVGANAEHGLPRNNADKRRAVKMLLADAEWAGKSDRWIAEHAKVSHPTVAAVRAALTSADDPDEAT